MSSVSRSVRPPGMRAKDEEIEDHVGCALDVRAHDRLPAYSGMVWKVAMNL